MFQPRLTKPYGAIDLATSLCTKLGQPNLVMAIVESFDNPEHTQHWPITKDWVKYNVT